jgi:hypothetical protein
LQAGAPFAHWALRVQCSTSVAVLVAPALVTVMVLLPGGRTIVDVQVQVPFASTMVTQRVWVPDVTVTL